MKGGGYYNLKPWITGGPYAAVYLYGIKSATRGRKKVYVHRLVANHFVGGKKPGNVVHHTVSPASNTKSTLEWVTPSENLNARKYFNDDGTRRKKTEPKVPKDPPVKAPKQAPKPVKINVPSPPKSKLAASRPSESASAPPPLPKKQKHVKTKVPMIDKDAYHPSINWSFAKKMNWLLVKVPEFKADWKKFRKEMPMVNRKNFLLKFKEATNKGLEKKLDQGPRNWMERIRAAMYAIREKLEV